MARIASVAADVFSDTVKPATMLHVLHLHPASLDFQTSRSIELLRKHLDADMRMSVAGIGAGGSFREGNFGNVAEAIIRLRLARRGDEQIVHAWGPAELFAAVVAGFSRIIFSPQGRIAPNWRPWVDRLLRRWAIEVVCPTNWLRKSFIARGVPASRCQVIFPAVQTDRLHGADEELRMRLGIGKGQIVLLAPGESVREAGHVAAIWAGAILNVLDAKWRLLVWGRGPMTESLRRFASASRQEVLVDAQRRLGERIEFEQLAGAADGALVFSRPGAGVLPIAACMAAGLPVIAAETAELDEFLIDGATAVVEAGGNPRDVAQRILTLFRRGDELRGRIIRGARMEAQRRFAVDPFISAWRQVYDSLDRQ